MLKGLENVQAFLKEITDIKNGPIGGELRKTFYMASQETAAFTRRRYAHYGTAPSAFHTLVATSGKKKGNVRPARPPRRPTSPTLHHLQMAVRTRMVNRLNHRVEIDPSARHPDPRLRDPQGLPLRALAYWVENPVPTVITMTLRMVAYFNAIRNPKKKTRRRGGHVIPNRRLNGVIVHTPRSRPVWRETADFAVKKQVPAIIRGIQRAITRTVLKHGGKVR